jgi:enolase
MELRDKDASRYLGKGVLTAVKNVNDILSPAVIGSNPQNLKEVDDLLCRADGTELKTKAGGNAITAASFAIAEAGAKLAQRELFEHLATSFFGDAQPDKFTFFLFASSTSNA